MVIEVACGVILDGDKVLCVQRSETMSLPLKWEFPGGKIELGETEIKKLNKF
jgi:8-oxo-dGTP diphosphatase